jgi:methionine aminopeptidase
MSITNETDCRGLREVGRVVRLTLDVLERHTAPGITTGEQDRIAHDIFMSTGTAA